MKRGTPSAFDGLFDVPIKNSSKEFEELRMHPKGGQYRAWINELWRSFEPFAPPEFLDKFRKDEGGLESSIWEMLLAKKLLDSNNTLVRATTSDAPDICLQKTTAETCIWLECSLARPGDPTSSDSVEPIPLDGNAHLRKVDPSILRLTNAIGKKVKQYAGWLEKETCGPNDAFIIAIHTRYLRTGMYPDSLPDAAMAVFPLGEKTVWFGHEGEEAIVEYQHQPHILKACGSTVSTTYFASSSFKQVSGILVSDEWWGHVKSPGVYYSYIANPFADHPVDPNILPFAQMCKSEVRADGAVSLWID